MPIPILPTVAALSSDDDRLDRELRVAAVRGQTAIVRALMDEVDRFAGAPLDGPLSQLAEEMMRLGCSALAAASALSGAPAGPKPAIT